MTNFIYFHILIEQNRIQQINKIFIHEMRFLFQLKIILQNDIFETVKLSIQNGVSKNEAKWK